MTDNVSQEDISPFVGEILKQARLEKGLTLEQVSKILRINRSQLSILEDDTKPHVCDVYKLGFLKIYAQYLGLDADDLMEKFKSQSHSHSSSSALVFPAPLPGRGLPSARIMGGCFLALMALVVGWKWMDSRHSVPEAYEALEVVEAKVAEESPVQVVEEPLVPVSVPEEETVVTEESFEASPAVAKTVSLHVRESAWIEVKDLHGNVVFSKICDPGEVHEFKNPEKLFLTTGNLKGTQLSSADKTFLENGQSGEVKRNIPLDPAKWVE